MALITSIVSIFYTRDEADGLYKSDSDLHKDWGEKREVFVGAVHHKCLECSNITHPAVPARFP